MGVKQSFRETFAVPDTTGTYAAERITFGVAGPGTMPEAGVDRITSSIEDADSAGAEVELWLRKNQPTAVAGVPDDEDDYYFSGESHTAGTMTVELASWRGAQIRVKSTGVAGDVVVNANSAGRDNNA